MAMLSYQRVTLNLCHVIAIFAMSWPPFFETETGETPDLGWATWALEMVHGWFPKIMVFEMCQRNIDVEMNSQSKFSIAQFWFPIKIAISLGPRGLSPSPIRRHGGDLDECPSSTTWDVALGGCASNRQWMLYYLYWHIGWGFDSTCCRKHQKSRISHEMFVNVWK